jgi:hypothetical protein
LALLQEIAGEETAVKSTLAKLGLLLDARLPMERQLHEILQAGERLLLNESGLDLATPLAALQFLRRPVFALALLAGVGRALTSTPERQPLLSAMERFFDDEQRMPLREQLQQWVIEGPLFLRYLMVRLIENTGFSPSERRASQVLLDIYRRDSDPLVSSAAIEAYAGSVELAELPTALALLREEYSTLARRTLSFRWDFGHRDSDRAIGIRMRGSVQIPR